MRIASPAHAFFALTMIALGVIGFVTGGLPPIWSGVPKGLPGREVVIYLCATVCLVTGAGLLVQRTAAIASRVLLGYLLLWFLVVRMTHFVLTPTAVDAWWSLGDTLVMVAGAWVLYVWFASGKGLRIAQIAFGLGLIPFGLAHFLYLKETVVDVPKYLPWPVFWAYFTGATFIIAGIALAAGFLARLAATLSAVQIALFTVLVWIPIVVKGPNAFQWAEFLNSWALTAGAWMVADSYRVR
jgi:uncharacterized membrane protein